LENFDDNGDISRASVHIRKNIRISTIKSLDHYKLKQHGFMKYVQSYYEQTEGSRIDAVVAESK
jgi:hypothetical protein